MTIRSDRRLAAASPIGRNSTPSWIQWVAYGMCGWSLLFAILHFAAATDSMTTLNESQRSAVNRAAWLLCIGMLGVIGTVSALALIQARTHTLPQWLMRTSVFSGSVLLLLYVLFSFWVDDFYWMLAPGVLCVVGAVVALALIQPWGRYLAPRLMLFFAWAGGVVLTLHALYGYVVHGLAALGIITWTQVQQWAGAPITPLSAAEIRELITASLLIWNPWFLLGGLLYLIVAWYASRHPPTIG